MITKDNILEDYVLVSVLILEKNKYIFCAELYENQNKGLSMAHILYWEDGNWSEVNKFKMQPVALAKSQSDNYDAFLLGREGECVGFNKSNHERFDLSGDSLSGPFRSIKVIENTLYVLGEDTSLWRLVDQDWSQFKTSIDEDDIESAALEDDFDVDDFIESAIDSTQITYAFGGFTSKNIMTIGSEGSIEFYDGSSWEKLDSPTESRLSDLCHLSNDEYIICGSQGTIVIGNNEKLEVKTLKEIENDFCSVAVLDDQVFLADGHSLFLFKDNQISKVDFGEKPELAIPSHFVISDCGTVLSIAGKEALVSHDGKSWRSLLHS